MSYQVRGQKSQIGNSIAGYANVGEVPHAATCSTPRPTTARKKEQDQEQALCTQWFDTTLHSAQGLQYECTELHCIELVQVAIHVPRRLFFRIHHTQLLNTSDCIMVTLPLDKFIEVACFPSHNLTQCVAGKPCALSSSSSSLGWFLRYFLMIIIAKNGGYFTCLCASLSLSLPLAVAVSVNFPFADCDFESGRRRRRRKG